MRRRRLLVLGLGGSVAVATLGGVGVLWRALAPGAGLSRPAQAMFESLAVAVLADLLPRDPARRAAMLAGQAERVATTMAQFAPAVQDDLAQLVGLLTTAPTRWALTGLRADWAEATPEAVREALAGLRDSRLAVRQQIYHALRDLTCAAFFAEPAHTALMGYPGPRPITVAEAA